MMERRASRGPDRGVPDRAAHEGRDRGGARPASPHDARPGAPVKVGAATCSTPPARAAARPPSTSPPRRPSSPPARAAAWPSTATARPPASRGSADLLEALGRAHRPRAGRDRRVHRRRSASASCSRRAPPGDAATSCRSARSSAVRTLFNFLGPLTNPAGATPPGDRRLRPDQARAVAGALAQLGSRSALVVSSADGLDEISVGGETRVVEVTPAGIERLRRHAGGASAWSAARSRPFAAATPDAERRDRARGARRRARATSARWRC